MKVENLRTLIRESIQEYIREVETSGNIAAQEAKIKACEEAIAIRERKANMEGLDEAYHDMMDSAKMNEIKKEIKELQKYKAKAEKLLEKMKAKAEGKKDVVSDAKMDEAPIEEADVTAEMEVEENIDEAKEQTFSVNNLQHSEKHKPFKKLRKEKPGTNRMASSNQTDNEKDEPFNQGKTKNQPVDETVINESFLKMQKLAGVITEGQYRKKVQMLNEKMSYDDFESMVKPFLDLAKTKGWVWNGAGDSWF